MKELYRSFEGKLDVDNQSGYIIYDNKKTNTYEIQFINVTVSKKSEKFRVSKNLLSQNEFSNLEKIQTLYVEVGNGVYENGQISYKNRWYSAKMIRDIQKDRQDQNWKKYV